METPKRSPTRHTKKETQEGAMSAVPSLIKSVTPANRQKKMEIPPTQSPATPMLLRYTPGPPQSPLASKSTNHPAASSEITTPENRRKKREIPSTQSPATPWLLRYSPDPQQSPLASKSSNHPAVSPKTVTPSNRRKKMEPCSPATPMLLRYSSGLHESPLASKSTNHPTTSSMPQQISKTPKGAIIPDSCNTTHYSSPTSNHNSTVKDTASKKLTFDLPGDKENITPGREKPKSPKPKTQSTGRRPLQEVPDSDDDLDEDFDETEYESTDDEREVFCDPESPTLQRQNRAMARSRSLKLEQGSPEPVGELEPIVLPDSPLLDHESSLKPSDNSLSLQEHKPEEPLSSRPEVAVDDHAPNKEHDLGSSTEAEAKTDVQVNTEAPEPDPRTRQVTPEPTPVSAVKQKPKSGPSLPTGKRDVANSLSSPSLGDSYHYTQGLESQRLPLDAIRALGPQTTHSDIMVSLHPEHVAKIVDRTKNHEFRAWKIPQQVSRVWFYVTRPECQLKYMCLFGEAKVPGEIKDKKGIGNVEFNEGKTATKFAYEILQVYELNNPVLLDEMKKKGWVSGAPQKYTYIPPAVVGELTANLRCALFEDAVGDSTRLESSPLKTISESQELKAQLQDDATYSTQHYSGTSDEIILESQWPSQNNVSSGPVAGEKEFARPALSGARTMSSSHGSSPLPSQKQQNFVRPSQATTVSQVSSSPAKSPAKPSPNAILISSDAGSSPTAILRRGHSLDTVASLQSPQFPTRSQMLPESLVNKDIQEPPDIVWDSADEHSD
ncbi:hypothetical protein GGR50DRAFT_660679 [Xylaria sp. CBS 124048]|nr:hypothetical protein GGR50DRAFT_660679 [Xylaria sp. CBS 124048]